MEHTVNSPVVAGLGYSTLECPRGCRFSLVCWFIPPHELPVEVIWFCIGRTKGGLLEGVPVGAWAIRPCSKDEGLSGNG
ncbi:MAG: hypothetical protein ANABAC_2862 [Anaerolineae bacterium]|mgnify:CR=1 FL=1|jgi:hypothetical protein|nr:MAG: hypothetical protein ANABAC_2862 [Anaerolineae bacterium]